jgi:hypothetical protein
LCARLATAFATIAMRVSLSPCGSSCPTVWR